MSKLIAASTLAAVCLIFATSAPADDWTGTTGDWSDGANWSGGVAPGAIAYIDNGGTARITASDSIGSVKFTLGNHATDSGNVIQQGGVVMSAPWDIVVGYGGQGSYLQNSGTVITNRLSIAASKGSSGSYTIVDGYLRAQGAGGGTAGLHVADYYTASYGGSGQFFVHGGRVLTNKLIAGVGGTAEVGISGGVIEAGTAAFGYAGTCNVFQSSGTLKVAMCSNNGVGSGSMTVGCFNGSSAVYELSGGGLSATALRIGYGSVYGGIKSSLAASGTFHQTGGSVTTDKLIIGIAEVENVDMQPVGVGTYQIDAGTLDATSLSMGSRPLGHGTATGVFLQTGGTVTLGRLTMNGACDSAAFATCNLSGGTMTTGGLFVAGTFSISNAKANLIVTGETTISAIARFEAVHGSALRLSGTSFSVQSTTASDVAGLGNLSLYVAGQGDLPMQIEAASLDFGPHSAGLDGNFSLDSLILGEDKPGRVQLVDLYENQLGSSLADCVYVHHLVVGPGSELDLNGLHLYYDTFENEGGTVVANGGSLQQVPEPATIFLMVVGGLVATYRRRR